MEKSSPSRVAGVVIRKVTLGEVEYLLTQVDRVRKAAQEESLIVSRRIECLEAMTLACAKIPGKRGDRVLDLFIEKIICGMATNSEWAAYFNSAWRKAFRFWNALDPSEKEKYVGRPCKPDDIGALLQGVEWAYELLMSDDRTKAEMDALELAVTTVSQSNEVGESSGSPAI